MSRTLTKKRRGFIKDYVETGNAGLAAEKNYNVKNNHVARSIGSELLTKPDIKAELYKLGFNSDNAKRVVAEIMNDETVEPRDRLRASELTFKVNKDFNELSDTKVLIVNVSGEVAAKYAIERGVGEPPI